MAEKATKIGKLDEIAHGKGLRFDLSTAHLSKRALKKAVASGEPMASGFVVGFDEQLYAYENSCPHLGVELDWEAGDFFNEDQSLLVCSTHGAMFDPQSGECVSGPCLGDSLKPLVVSLDQGEISYFPGR